MEPNESVMDYFFEGGDPHRPRRQVVTREELFRVLEWHHGVTIRRMTVWGRLRAAWKKVPNISPYAWMALQRRKK